MIGWLKSLFRGDQLRKSVALDMGGLQLVPSSYSTTRAETAMPGTADLPQLLELVPPPIDDGFVFPDHDDKNRDYPPNPVAEFSIEIPCAQTFETATLSADIGSDRGLTFFVRTPEGRTTYMNSANSPPLGAVLIPAWTFWPDAGNTPDSIATSMARLLKRLAVRPEGFEFPDVPMQDIKAAYEAAQQIITIAPENAMIHAALPSGNTLCGTKVWNTLHQLGFRWGDMDCFQWADPTNQADYLIWVEVQDNQLGYALPEEIAAGRQNFFSVTFSVSLPRSPAPIHVTEQMIRAAHAFAVATGADLSFEIDNVAQSEPDALLDAAREVTQKLAALGTKPGASAVCMLR